MINMFTYSKGDHSITYAVRDCSVLIVEGHDIERVNALHLAHRDSSGTYCEDIVLFASMPTDDDEFMQLFDEPQLFTSAKAHAEDLRFEDAAVEGNTSYWVAVGFRYDYAECYRCGGTVDVPGGENDDFVNFADDYRYCPFCGKQMTGAPTESDCVTPIARKGEVDA